MQNINPTQTNAWKALTQHHAQRKNATIQELFAQEKDRFNKYSLTFNDEILVDFSKNNLTQETLGLLRQLSENAAWHKRRKPCLTVKKSTVLKIVPYYIPHFSVDRKSVV